MFNQFHQKYCMACHILNEFLPRPAPNNQLLACLTRLNDKKTKIKTLKLDFKHVMGIYFKERIG